MQRWLNRLPAAICELKAVLGVGPLPPSVTLLPWEVKTIEGLVAGPLSSLASTNPSQSGGNLTSHQWGELIGSGALFFTLLAKPTEGATTLESEFPEIKDHRTKFVDDSLYTLMPVLAVLATQFEMPSLAAHREFATGYLARLYSSFHDDGVTMKKDNEKYFLLFLFWMHREELRPGLVGSITDVHKWVNEVSRFPISLGNVRKIANFVGLKLAGVGKPAKKLKRREKKA